MAENMSGDLITVLILVSVVLMQGVPFLIRAISARVTADFAKKVLMPIDKIASIIGVIAFLFGAVASLIPLYIHIIQPLISNEWAMIPALLVSAGFYRLRGTHPFIYGLAEILVGMTATWSGIHAGTTSLIAQAIAFFGGLYIIVRGLDNVDKGLPQRMRPWWDVCFPKAGHP